MIPLVASTYDTRVTLVADLSTRSNSTLATRGEEAILSLSHWEKASDMPVMYRVHSSKGHN